MKETKALIFGADTFEIMDEKARPVANVATMKSMTNLIPGNVIKTLGYHEPNDGGAGLYLIKERTGEHIEDNGTIHFIGEELIAELIIENDFINIRQFGAKGDGETDDTVSFQNAINSNKKVFINDGEYIVSNLLLNNNLILKGSNKATILKKDDLNLITSENFELSLENIIFDNNFTNGKTFLITNSKSLKVENCTFKNNNSLNGNNSIKTDNVENIEVRGCVFENIKSNCMQLNTGYKLIIEDNYFKDIGNEESHREGSPFYASKWSVITVNKNTIINCTDSGIYCDNSYSELVNITNNKIVNCGKEAIKNQTRAKKTIITGNIIDGVVNQGILITGTSEDTIVSNNIIHNFCKNGNSKGSRFSAIGILASNHIVVSNNIIRYGDLNKCAGIYITSNSVHTEDCDNVIVNGNIIDCISGFGIYLQRIKNVSIVNNRLSNCCMNTSGYKSFIYVNSASGLINNNDLLKPEEVRGNCFKVSANTIKLPEGFPSCDLTNAIIKIHTRSDGQNANDEVLETSITNFVADTKIATLNDNINFTNEIDELEFKITNNFDVTYPIRLYSSCDFVIIGNKMYASNGNLKIDLTDTISMLPISSEIWNFNKLIPKETTE